MQRLTRQHLGIDTGQSNAMRKAKTFSLFRAASGLAVCRVAIILKRLTFLSIWPMNAAAQTRPGVRCGRFE